MASDSVAGVSFHDFSDGGETGRLIANKDWSATTLGPRRCWSRSLNNYLSMILELPTAAILFWGPEQIQLYNDGYSVIMGPRHPRYLGAPFRECWPEAYDTIAPWMRRVLQNGETVEVTRTLVPLTRFGFTEEAYFTFSFSPLRGDDGDIAGVLQLVTEVSDAVIGDRAHHPNPTGDTTAAEAPRPVAFDAASHVLEAEQWNEAATSPVRTSDDATDGSVLDGKPQEISRPRERVLIVDDNADMRHYLVRLLSPNWSVETAPDGEAALSAALQRPPDLVLTDVMMPRMDGVALLAALRAHPKTRTVPIVLLSARAGEDEIVGGLDTGADDYLAKPFTARELLARVRTHLNIARLRREWAAVLERANKELEAFSYSVSHDLRAPLRAIDGFTKALMDEYGPTLDDTAGHYLRRVRRATLRMSELIDDLLALSRIARAPVERTRVDVTALARRIVTELQEGDPARRVDVSIAVGMTADADSRLLAVALENLLGNAWKFTAKRADARIEVGRELRSPAHVFFVRDNGAGFDMAHATRLFSPFQRLHAESDFPGTGIGLATVQRVVSRHGGRIWAEGAADRGATFSFTLGGLE